MKKVIRLKESDLIKMVERVISEQNNTFKQYNTDFSERPGINKFPTAYETRPNIINIDGVSGSNLFAIGKSEVNTNNADLKNIVTKCKTRYYNCNPIVVDGYASKTSFGGNAPDSPEAMRLNKELAAKRRDNLVKFLRSQDINATAGKAEVVDNENARKVTLTSQPLTIDDSRPTLIDRDNTSVITPTVYNRKYKRVCIKVPEDYLSDFLSKLKTYAWWKGDKLPYSVKDYTYTKK